MNSLSRVVFDLAKEKRVNFKDVKSLADVCCLAEKVQLKSEALSPFDPMQKLLMKSRSVLKLRHGGGYYTKLAQAIIKEADRRGLNLEKFADFSTCYNTAVKRL